MNLRQLSETFSVTGQLTAGDMAKLKALGFATVINNRPDGEEPGQPLACDIAKAAQAAGLAYAHIPVSGAATPAQVQAMRDALSLPGPTLAFCRSGGRSTALWRAASV